ncbi:MAG: cell division topological specificity factor MinE [Anaerolineales bacterium]|jgi:cell division topological specificity factor|nr:cell division topological specificity factor MinE [Anaerolineales bacterium]MBM2850185.1 cell division topological specificity factor MinE [Anaerolineales bacterium]
MSNFFDRLLGRSPRETSAQTAKERLQLVLIHDRTDVPPAVMDLLKDEIITVISRHVDIDREGVEITLTQNQRENRLVANIPLLDAPGGGRKRRR